MSKNVNEIMQKYLNEMPPMSPGRREKMRLQAQKTPALTADDKLEKVVQCNMSFTGSWSVPIATYIVIEGSFGDIKKYFKSTANTKTLLINQFNQEQKSNKERSNKERESGYQASGYSILMNFNKAGVSGSPTKTEIKDNLTFSIYQGKNPF